MSGIRCELALALCSLTLVAVAGCRKQERAGALARGEEIVDAAPPWSAKVQEAPAAPRGMVWIPEGALIAGTPVDLLPRIADEEMPGQQVVLGGFFIDQFAYPNEEGAIPETGATHAEAAKLCSDQGKRLCTELEWERACKGPQNFTYEYGDRYRPEACLTGKTSRMLPSGYRPACRSEFGVRDMHGGVWEWTASPWGRGTRGELYTLRGGNGAAGDVVGRCANAISRPPDTASSQIGFRCCKGPKNSAEVELSIERGPALEQRGQVDRVLGRALEAALPADVRRTLSSYGLWHVTAMWDWRPIGNVSWLVAGGCAGASPTRRCGVVVARTDARRPELVAWVWAGLFPPAVRVRGDPRRLWVYGGDRLSHYRQPVFFEWGRVRVGDVERNVRPGAD